MVMRRAVWTVLTGLAACGEPTWGAFVPIVTADGWRAWEGADPFGEQGDRLCDPLGYGPEFLGQTDIDPGTPAFQVKTGVCDWATLYQPTTVEVKRSDRFEIRVFHEPLIGPAGTLATVGVSIEDEIVWLEPVPILPQSGFLVPQLELNRELPVGTVLLFHVDNHGANSYHLIDIGASPRE